MCGDASVNYNCTDFYNCSTRPCTGCVATATAQVIKYWQPTNGFNYNYSSMPSTYGNVEVQRLMRDVGQSVGMNYNCNLSGGSSADGSKVPWVLKNSFGFSSGKYGGYNYYLMVSDLFNNRPVILDGCRVATDHWFIINWWTSYSECHQWVCDGFIGTIYKNRIVTSVTNKGITTITYQPCSDCVDNGYFHMNWGWNETQVTNNFNGWFLYSNWDIVGANRNYQYAIGMGYQIYN
ncbi:MAG: hypothetical protein EAZ35_07195 [Sphingobacteriia bacterium]|nr:MAG: hypothetical protein EAZ41_10385 [Sphingobacteriia bacterium]TAG30428.1 MAG: hypothetical protein EAZ35_07195 [Sphingobacteriia bacterium]